MTEAARQSRPEKTLEIFAAIRKAHKARDRLPSIQQTERRPFMNGERYTAAGDARGIATRIMPAIPMISAL
jgi:hypothetical protein